ncbi:MAG: MlaD family protein [Sulfuricellaceae bacterium]
MPAPNLNDLPEALAIPKRRRLPQLVWIVPLVALIIGGWLVANTIAQRGPTVVISFLAAEGIEPGKTRIRYKNVDIGEVKNVEVAKDRSHVLVTAQLVKQAENFLVSDTRFWVVRPRISGGKISGIGTLLSGAYIGVDIGKSSEASSMFVGLEVAPVLTNGLPGRHFVLQAANIGSLDIGSPVYFRRIQVGEVVAYELDKDGGNVTVKVFIHAPYDRHVTPRMRFWNASGIDVSLDANGVRLQSQSLASVLLGGIAFEALDGDRSADEAPADTTFVLYPDRATAMKAPDGKPLLLTLYFEDSIRGLAPGAPLDFRGIVVGEVLAVGVEFEPKRDWFHFPVHVALYTERIGLRGSEKGKDSADMIKQGLMKAMNERGFRAQLRTGNLLTGQSYIALDFFPDLKKIAIDWNRQPLELPTVRSNFEEIQVSLAKVLAKLGKMPLDEIGADIRNVLKTLERSVNSIDKLAQRVEGETAPEINAGIKDMRATLKSIDKLVQRVDGEMAPEVIAGIKDMRATFKSLDKLAQRVDGETVPEVNAGIKDMRSILRSVDKLAQRVDGEIMPEVNAGIKDARATFQSLDKLTLRVDREMAPEIMAGIKDVRAAVKSLDKLALRVDGETVPEVNAGIKDIRATLKNIDKLVHSMDKLAQRIDGEVAPQVIAGVKELRAALVTVERLLSEDAPLQQDVRDALREVGRAAQSFRFLADTFERQPEALLRGKKEELP